MSKRITSQDIINDVDRLRTAAGLHAYIGDGGGEAIYHIGRIAYIVCHAAGLHGLGNSPEARILAGTANELAELAQSLDTIESRRNTLIAGLSAIERLMPVLSEYALIAGTIRLQELTSTPKGIGTNDVKIALSGNYAW